MEIQKAVDVMSCLAAMLSVALCAAAIAQDRPRAREIGIAPGLGQPGPDNAITDVPGVKVGHTTLRDGDRIRTGVTAILPHGGNLFQDKVAGAVFVGNAFGKLAGSTQVEELGTIESPIVLTSTLSVGIAIDATVRWTLAQPGNEDVRSVNALVGETNDGALNDIRSMPVTRDHVTAAITGAKAGPVEEGAVGAGTGTIAFGWKGGIGTSSRRLRQQEHEWTVGALVQSNYGGRLTIAGVPVWKELTPRSESVGSRRRRLVHDRHRDRCTDGCPGSEASRCPGDLRARPHRIDVSRTAAATSRLRSPPTRRCASRPRALRSPEASCRRTACRTSSKR